MDVTTVGWLAFWASFGYLLIGLGMGALVSNFVYEDGGDVTDSYVLGGLSVVLWPIALIIVTGALIWFGVISKILTPRKHLEKVRKIKEERKAEGKPLHATYVD